MDRTAGLGELGATRVARQPRVQEHVQAQVRPLAGTGAGGDLRRDDLRGPRHDAGAASIDMLLPPRRALWERLGQNLASVNKELWLVLSLFVIALALNYLVTAQRIVLGFYTLPTLFSAYFFGRRHAVLTAIASVCLVVLLAHYNPAVLSWGFVATASTNWLSDVVAWAGMLVVTAYAMGTLYERNAARVRELRRTYQGLLMILRQFISKDKYTENHSYRVSVYAAAIASQMGLSAQRIEDIRAGALLHDIGKLDVSRDLLYKAAALTREERERMSAHVDFGAMMIAPVNDSLERVLPIILLHHARYDAREENERAGIHVPLEARIVSVADVYDALTSDRPYRAAMSPFAARDVIAKDSAGQFDPRVTNAFLAAFEKGTLEVPNIVV